MDNDWRKPFLELFDKLQSLYRANLSVYHNVLLSTNRTRAELESSFEVLEPAYFGKTLAKAIHVETEGCAYHGHLFFAPDRRGLDQLERILDGGRNLG